MEGGLQCLLMLGFDKRFDYILTSYKSLFNFIQRPLQRTLMNSS